MNAIMNGGSYVISRYAAQRPFAGLAVILAVILLFLIRATLVFFVWNRSVPIVIRSLKPDFDEKKSFRPISFQESMLVCVLFIVLFS